jgi:hypothetical protein
MVTLAKGTPVKVKRRDGVGKWKRMTTFNECSFKTMLSETPIYLVLDAGKFAIWVLRQNVPAEKHCLRGTPTMPKGI